MEWSTKELGAKENVEIAIKGDCDLYGAPNFAKSVLSGIEAGWRHILLDCSQLEYLDSTGVGTFIRIIQTLRRLGGTIRCRGLHGSPRRVLEMSNILPLMNEEKPKK
jgi:anti-anti-sigma factor